MENKKKAREMIQTFDNTTLASVARGEVNLNLLAREELVSRVFIMIASAQESERSISASGTTPFNASLAL
jgi:hypothetical protein